MSYSNGLLSSNTNNILTVKGPRGESGVGFKLTSSGDYDINNKIMYHIKTQDDVPDDSDYDSIKKDYGSAVNKEYLKNNFLKRDSKTQTFFDLKGYSIQNSEVYDQNSWNDKTITNKQYVDMKDDLKADKTELNKKADLSTNDEQTFKSIINVPDFDPGYSNMTNVMNKRYIDQKLDMKTTILQKIKSRLQVPDFDGSKTNQSDVANIKYLKLKYLNKEDGGQLQNSILFNSFHSDQKRQIFYLGSPLYPSSAVPRSFLENALKSKADKNDVTNALKSKADKNDVILLDDSKLIQADLKMGNHKITQLKNPTDDQDVVNKKYVDSQISKTIGTANDENVFRYIMEYHNSQLSEENDVELGDIKKYNLSPHQINKNTIDMNLLLDTSKGYYSSRIGVNLYPLSNDDYTLCFELMWPSSDVESIFLNGVSSVETVHNVKKKTLFSRKYSRLICQFTKSQNAYNNYLFIDIEIKLNAGVSYPSKFQTYFVIYGVVSLQSDINPGLYDALYFIENGFVYFNKEIDMQGNKIVGLGDNINNDSGAVNLKQLNTAISTSKKDINDSTVTLIKALQPKSYYTEIFETYFDITDPNNFIVDDTYGAEVKYVKCQNDNGFIVTEYMKDDFDLSLFNKQLGTVLNGSVISLSKTISTNKYTIFISFKHNTAFTDASKNLVGFGGVTNDKKFTYSDPRYSINNQKFIIDNQNDNNHQLSMLSQYQNKNLFMWIMKNGNNVRYGLVNGAYLDKTVNVRSVTTRNIIIELPYKIKRIGISTNAYSFSSKEFNKICFLEKGNGVYFI